MTPEGLRQRNSLDRVLDCILAFADNDDPKKAAKAAELYDRLVGRSDIANAPLGAWSHSGPAAMAIALIEWWVEDGDRPPFLASVPELWRDEEREEWEAAPIADKPALAEG